MVTVASRTSPRRIIRRRLRSRPSGQSARRRLVGLPVARASSRGFLFARTTRQVKSAAWTKEFLAAGAAVASIGGWGLLFALLAG
jgi:hypothetical protein